MELDPEYYADELRVVGSCKPPAKSSDSSCYQIALSSISSHAVRSPVTAMAQRGETGNMPDLSIAPVEIVGVQPA